jgi:hypothetical protein
MFLVEGVPLSSLGSKRYTKRSSHLPPWPLSSGSSRFHCAKVFCVRASCVRASARAPTGLRVGVKGLGFGIKGLVFSV